MCNRFRSIHAAENSARALQDHLRLNFPSGWNVAPTDLAPIVIGTQSGPPEGASWPGSASPCDPPPLKWSALKYGFRAPEDGRHGEAA